MRIPYKYNIIIYIILLYIYILYIINYIVKSKTANHIFHKDWYTKLWKTISEITKSQ